MRRATVVCLVGSLLTLAPLCPGQISTIPAMTNPSIQMTFDAMPLGTTTVAAINAFYGSSIANITYVAPLAGDGNYNVGTGLGRALGLEVGMTGNLALIDVGQNFGGGDGYEIDLGYYSTQIGLVLGDYVSTKTVTFYDGLTTLGTSTVGQPPVTFYESVVPFDRVTITGPPNYVLPELWVELGIPPPTCALTIPGGTLSGEVPVDVDAQSPAASPTLDITLQYSTDAGVTWLDCVMAAASPNPNPLVAVAPGVYSFTWDSCLDVPGTGSIVPTELQALVNDGGVGTCPQPVDVDNSPACTLTGPLGTVMGYVPLDVDFQLFCAASADVTLDFSTDAGATWIQCTMTGASPNPNPAVGVAPGVLSFEWDSRGDGAALGAPMTVDVRASVDDLVGAPGTCATTVDLDNTSLCGGICGDCDENGLGPTIVDALMGAQIAAGLVTPTLSQTGCCDVESSGFIGIVDALLMAQYAAGLPVTLTCP